MLVCTEPSIHNYEYRVLTVFYDCLHTKNVLFPQLAKPLHSRSKTQGQICTTVSTLSASHYLQNAKHTCIHQTQKYIMMSLPCNSKALTVKFPHQCANLLTTANRATTTCLQNSTHTSPGCQQFTNHVFVHLMAVFNRLAHRCGNLTVSALEFARK